MDRDVVFAAAAAERRALADQLAALTSVQWSTRSLCTGWDVRTVTAHLVAALSPSPLPFLSALVRARGRMHRANDAVAREVARRPTTDLVAALRAHAQRRLSPPVTGPRGPLTDVMVHAGDVRLPLGLPHDPPPRGSATGWTSSSRDVRWASCPGDAWTGCAWWPRTSTRRGGPAPRSPDAASTC